MTHKWSLCCQDARCALILKIVLRACAPLSPLKIVLYCLNTKHISVIFATQQEDTPAHLLLLQCHSCSPSTLLQLFVLFCARTAQRQCCLGSQRESRCLAGINAARAGDVCQEDASDKCGIDSFKVSLYDQAPRQRAETVHRVRIQT